MLKAPANHTNPWRQRIVGLDERVPLLDGRLAPYINLDNAASTPALGAVLDAVQRFLPYYSGVHRGTGFKSRLSTAAYDEAHAAIARFVGADPGIATVIFGKNTTEAINKLAFRYPLGPRQVVLSTAMEHHSNDLPWRRRAQVVRAAVTPDGRLDEDDMDRLLAAYGERVALLTVSGASNVTGYVQPIHRLARKAHAVGARILVDAAQLAAHRRIDVKRAWRPRTSRLRRAIGSQDVRPVRHRRAGRHQDTFLHGAPEHPGGGTVEIVTPTDVYWAGLPGREEAGSPNVIGAVAMAVAAQTLMDAGMDSIARHEASLTAYALGRLQAVTGLTVYGTGDLTSDGRSSRRHRVQRRIVTSCARCGHPRLRSRESACGAAVSARNPTLHTCWDARPGRPDRWQPEHLAAQRTQRPGMVRLSLGVYNTRDEVDALVHMVERITRHDYCGHYRRAAGSGDYIPADYDDAILSRFSLLPR